VTQAHGIWPGTPVPAHPALSAVNGTPARPATDRARAASRYPATPDGNSTGSAHTHAPHVMTTARAGRHTADRAQAWLRGAMLALAVLAMAAAAVSWDAQYVLVRSVKHDTVIAALEAGIPDVGALIFAALGIALALHARRAIRARVLNVACVGISLAMNAIASAPGWRDLAIWVMPSAVYALASDTLIGVVRAWVIARHDGRALADDEATPMAIIGGLFLWLLRLALAPVSTITGFRRWALDECPLAPGRTAPRPALPAPDHSARDRLPASPPAPVRRISKPGKQARLLALAASRHDLASIPLKQVSGIANTIGAEVSLSPGTARRVLLAHVRALQASNSQTSPGSTSTEATS
jgi:hypothetical protein